MQKGKFIEPYQLFFILIQAQIGVSIVTLPYDVFKSSHIDSWMTIILTGVIIQIVILLYIFLISRFPTYTLFEMSEAIFGRIIGTFFNILYVAYYVFLISFTLAKYSLILSVWMMPLTPSWVLILLAIMLVVYMLSAELKIISRFLVVTSLILLVYIGFNFYALKDVNITYILPIGTSKVLNGVPGALSSFSGIETLLILHAYVYTNKRKLFKISTWANVFTTMFYTFTVMTVLLFMSPEEIKLVPEPVLYLVKSFTFKVIERPDLIFTSIWIVLVVTTLLMFSYVTIMGIQQVSKKVKKTPVIVSLFLISFIISVWMKGVYVIQTIAPIFNYVILLFMFVIPMFYVIASIALSKREDH